MRVWFLVSRWGGGGLERVQANLAEAMRKLGDDVELVAGRVETGCHIHSGSVGVLSLRATGAFSFVAGLLRMVRERRPRLIFTTSNDVACLVLLLKLLRLIGADVIVTQHLSLSAPRRQARGLKRIKLEVIRVFMATLLPFARSILAVSNGVAKDLRDELRLNCPIEVVHNPIITPLFHQLAKEPLSWPWENRSLPTIIWVGRLAPEKRLDVLVDAFALMQRSSPARLLIVGGGGMRESVCARIAALGIEDRCRLVGFVDNPLPLVRESQLLVLCSDYEGFGNVLVEAMACGTDVVATDCPYGPSEILEEGRLGRLVAVGDVQELAVAMSAVLSQGSGIPLAILKARADAFSTDSAVERYRNIIYG